MISKRAFYLVCCLFPVTGLAQGDPVADTALPPNVEELPLDLVETGTAGLLSSKITGLPLSLWQGSDPETLATLMAAVETPIPAMRTIMRTLMIAEANPPARGRAGTDHFLHRIDWLTDAGAVEEALALLELSGTESPELFDRWASLSLLYARAEPVCLMQTANPQLSSDLALRIFCTARMGDWNQAALLLGTAKALGQIPSRQAELLSRFLDQDWHEQQPPMLPPVRPSVLEFRLFEALGEPLPTAPLPLKFAVLDLAGDNGWRAQLEAAERLARAGSLPPNQLLGLYSLRQAAASGGVWDRVAALQSLESALESGSTAQIARRLEAIWPQMASAGLLVPFAELYADRLAEFDLEGRAGKFAGYAGFLSPRYEELSGLYDTKSDDMRWLATLARGGPVTKDTKLPHAGAIAQAFGPSAMPKVLQTQLDEDRLGEVILRALALFASGAEGNHQDLVDALATLRGVGLEDAARRAALELVILDAERARR